MPAGSRKKRRPDEAFSPAWSGSWTAGSRSPRTSSLGRVFDGVAALVGLRRKVSFEGQAAMELEALASGRTDIRLPFTIREADSGDPRIPPRREIRSAVSWISSRPSGRSRRRSSRAVPGRRSRWPFTTSCPRPSRRWRKSLRSEAGLNRVVLSGGCFQNRLLLTGCLDSLREAGFEVFHHRLVPTNDGGISLGQAVCAGARHGKGALTR